MSATQPLRLANASDRLPRHQANVQKPSAAPRIFALPPGESTCEYGNLFDFKAKPGYYNAAAKAALLRRSKKGPLDELFVDFSRPDVRIELSAADVRLLTGDWTWRATAAGQELSSQGPWNEVCWQRDDDCDYLEIELPLSHGWKLERQMLLTRRDRFLLLADALIGPSAEAVEIRHSFSLPLSPLAALESAQDTREGWLLANNRRRATIVPPALPEWRSEFRHAELTAEGERIALHQAALGHNLFAPLWIDLDPKRLKRPLTWRQLTVGENLAIVGRDVAAAYRIQAGPEQWLVYRSLTPEGNRSVLGLHTLSAFVVARILPTGLTEEIVAVE